MLSKREAFLVRWVYRDVKVCLLKTDYSKPVSMDEWGKQGGDHSEVSGLKKPCWPVALEREGIVMAVDVPCSPG